jgi:hypothetical protein
MDFLHALLFGYARRRTKKENFLLVQPSMPGRAVSEGLVAAYDFNHVSIMLGPRMKAEFSCKCNIISEKRPSWVYISKQSGSPVIFDEVYNWLASCSADQKWRSSDGSSASLN